MELALQTPSQKWEMMMQRIKPAARFIFMALAVLAVGTVLMMLAQAANTTDEFAESSGKIESWIKGNLGKTIILGGLVFSLGAFAITRDMKVLFYPLIAAIAIGVIVGIINTTFTAVI